MNLRDLWPIQPNVLEAYSTFAAALFAALAAVFAYRAYLKESRIEKRLRDSDERAQASLVAAWIGSDPEPDAHARVGGSFVVIRNASQTPIFDVSWWVESDQQFIDGDDEKLVPPSAHGVRFRVPIRIFQSLNTFEDSGLDGFPVGIGFTDSSGVRWRRNPDGRLHRQSSGYV